MSMLKPDYIDIDNDGNTTEPMRDQYVIGGLAKILSKSVIKKLKNLKAKANTNSKDAVKFQDESINVYEQLIDEGLSADEATKALQDALDIKVGMYEGGLLDNRDQYVIGGIVKAITKIAKKFKGKKDIHTPEFKKYMREKLEKEFPDLSKKELDAIMKDLNKPMGEGFPFEEYAEFSKMPKDIKVFKNKGGPMSMDDQMLMVMTAPQESEMESDDDMEDNYTRFIMEEALTEEEEDMLMSKLEQDEELAMLFDKVIDVAQEFAGSGPVEGPGSGVSDSIPARLSDGEFVFTAKATEQIGADELMRMMKDAEAAADERQGLAKGGMSTDEEPETVTMVAEQAPMKQDIRVTKETVGSQAAMQEEEDLIGDEIKKGMLSARPYVRS